MYINEIFNNGVKYVYFHTVSRVSVSSQPLYGDDIVLLCEARLPPSGYQVNMRLEWFGPDGSDSENDGTTFGIEYVDGDTLNRNITFRYLVPNQNGNYTCRLTAYFENSNSALIETNEYHLEVMSKLHDCDYSTFNQNSCYYSLLPVRCFTGKLSTNGLGGIFKSVNGIPKSIMCSWQGENIARIEWFLEGLESFPIVSDTNASAISLTPDLNTDGLNGTRFTCRATTLRGYQFEETLTFQTIGRYNV